MAEPKRCRKVMAPHCCACTPSSRRARASQLGEQGPAEGAQHFARELRIVGAAVAECVGEREYPLANGHLGNHAIDEVGRGIGHAASAAGRAEAAPLAREGDEAVELAVVAVQAQESVGEDAAAQIGAELVLDEAGRRLIALASAREKGFELVANGLVEQRAFGTPRLVGGAAGSGGGRGDGPGPRRNAVLATTRRRNATARGMPVSRRSRRRDLASHELRFTRRVDKRSRWRSEWRSAGVERMTGAN